MKDRRVVTGRAPDLLIDRESHMNYCQIRCPECDEQNAIPLHELAVGYAVRCPYCGAGLFLNHIRPSADAELEWQLESVDPLEEERRST